MTKVIPVQAGFPMSDIARAMRLRQHHDDALRDLIMYGEDSRASLPGLFAPIVNPPVSAPPPNLDVQPRWIDGRPVVRAEDCPGGPALLSDGWRLMVMIWDPVTPRTPDPRRSKVVHAHWERDDGGRLDHADVKRCKYWHRFPTNRKRKRERCKARRRARLGGL